MQTLASNGFDTTPGNMYAAHMLGVNDAMKLLSSDPKAAIESTGVNPKAIKSNKLNGLTVEDYLNHTNNVMAKAPAPPSAPTAGRIFQKKDGGSVNDEPHPASMIPGFHVVTSQYGQPLFSGRM
jgi:hypothetical protein